MRAIRKLQVKKLRKQKGMSQSQLAKALGVTKEAVSLWERGRVPTDEMQQHLCDYFGVSFGELWGLEKGQEMPELDTSEFIPSQDFTYLWSALIAACSMVCKLQGEGNPYELMTKLIKQSTAKLSRSSTAGRSHCRNHGSIPRRGRKGGCQGTGGIQCGKVKSNVSS